MVKKLAIILATLTMAICQSAVLAQSQNPFIGSWDIDLNESDFGSATPPRNMSRTYFDHGDNTFTYMVITTNQDGSLTGSTSHYSYSGQKYAMASFNQDQRSQISYRKINDTTVEYRVYLNDEVQQIGAKFISPNYQQLTIAIQYPNSDQEDQILIFHRRQ